MADIAHPAIADTEQVTAEQHIPGAGPPSFSELVYAHHRWQTALPHGGAELARADADYRKALEDFEAKHGSIVQAYWCSSVESAVALTAAPRRFLGRLLGPRLAFHRVTDWATKGSPRIAGALHRCDELAVRAETVLTGVRRRICLQLVLACASHFLSLVDEPAAHERPRQSAAAAAEEKKLLDRTTAYYCEAANGQAQMIYFVGIAIATAAIGIAFALLWAGLGHRTLFAPVLAGVIGANISVVQRINSGQFELEYDVGWLYLVFLGALRPLLGGVFGLAVALAVSSGILHIPLDKSADDDAKFAALVVVAFLSGFSERWAQDALAATVPQAKQPSSSKDASPSA